MKTVWSYVSALKFYIHSYILTIVWGWQGYRDRLTKFNEKRRKEARKDERDIQGKIIIVTGNIGKQTAKELAAQGETVIMACRDPTRADDARKDILRQVPDAKLVFIQVDTSDRDSVRIFAQEFKKRYDHLDVLFNNAGIFSVNQEFVKGGFERHMGTNYLGPFLLKLLLLVSLLKSEHARIVFLSSTMTTSSDQHLKNLMALGQPLAPWTLKEPAVLVKRIVNWLVLSTISYPVEEGVENVLYCVLSKSLENESRRLYRYLDIWDAPEKIVSRYSGARLWEVSEELVGLKGFRTNFAVPSATARSFA